MWRTSSFAQLEPLKLSLDPDPSLLKPLCLPIIFTPFLKSLILISGMHLNQYYQPRISHPWDMDFTFSEDLVPHWLLTTTSHCKISWHMAYGVARPSGLTYKMLPRRPPSFPLPLSLSSPLLSSLAWVFLKIFHILFKFLNTYILTVPFYTNM